MSTVVCPGCGEQHPAAFRLCPMCGNPLHDPPAIAREERKVVTVFFCDLVGFTARAEALDPEDVERILDPYHQHLRGELERFGGSVEKFIGDAVMAVFGAPQAHEDDPERAVRAAVSIRDWAREQQELELRIAVTTGEALVALAARPEHGEAMVKGDVVNTAARLQAAAPINGILVGELTYRATRDRIEYSELRPVAAKGKAEPVRVWEVVQGRALVTVEREARAPLVGRERELSVLVDALARVREEREPQLVSLVGVPGIGKSRLVYELFRSIENGSQLVYWRRGRSLSYGEGVTFWALGEMVKAQAGILETHTAEQAEEKLRAALHALFDERDSAWLEVHLRPLVGLSSDADLGSERREEAFSAWRRFFERLAEERPLVLVFEDLHWADDAVLDFVDELLDWASGVPLLVVATARPELLARRPAWGGGKPNAVTISLSPLSDKDTARLVAALLGRPVVVADTQAALLAHAGGNPLFAEEFVRLVEEGGGEVTVPESVQGIIAARLDGLPVEAKGLLQDAAVVGRSFWVGALAAIEGAGREALEARLHTLERREFVRRERRSSVGDETEFIFRHALLRDVAYAQIPRSARAEKHRRAGEWIESLSPDRSEDQAEMLAHHYAAALEFAEAAGQPTADLRGRAYAALRDAGDRAFALSAYPAAARFYERALALAPEGDEAPPEILQRRARALQLVGDAGAEAALREARDALLATGESEPAAEVETFLAELAWVSGRADDVTIHMEHARALVADAGVSPARARVLAQLARFRMLAADPSAAIEAGREAVSLAAELGLADIQASALTTVGTSRTQLGDPDGRADVERAVEIALAANSHEASRAVYNLAGMLLDADPRRAAELFEHAAGLGERFGNAALRRHAQVMLIPALYLSGQLEEVGPMTDRFLAEFDAMGGHYFQAAVHTGSALRRLAFGDLDRALADARKGVSLARQAKDPQAVVGTIGRAVRVYVSLGHLTEARALTMEMITRWSSAAAAGADYFSDFAWVAHELGVVDEVRRLVELDRSLEWVSRQASLALLARDDVGAAETFAAAGRRTEEAEARLRAAEQLVAEGRRAEADVQLQHALAFYRSVGASFYIRRAEQVLAASA